MTIDNKPGSEETADLCSVHTSNLGELFEQLQISLIVSVYSNLSIRLFRILTFGFGSLFRLREDER